MVREVAIMPDFTPGFVEVGGRIPKLFTECLMSPLEKRWI